ncbi:MAG: HAD family hydrolase [Candidatus Dormibacteria bacterium]
MVPPGAPAARFGGRSIRALLLDYGLTLVTFSRPAAALLRAHEEVARRLRTAGVGQVPPAKTLLAEVHDRVEAAVARHEDSGDLREIDATAEERQAYAALGLQLPDQLLDEVAALAQRAWWEGVVVPPATIATLEELRRRGLRLGLCSNAPYRAPSLHAQLAQLGLSGLFDTVTFSSEVGWRKPATEIFATALGALGAEASLCAMVGDRRREDVAGARTAGMATIRTREHRDDVGPDDADAVIDRLSDLVPLLFAPHDGDKRGSVGGDDTSG